MSTLEEVLGRAGIPARRVRRASQEGPVADEAGASSVRVVPWWVWTFAALLASTGGTWAVVAAFQGAGRALDVGGTASVSRFTMLLVVSGLAAGLASWFGQMASRELSATVRTRQIRGLLDAPEAARSGDSAASLGRVLDVEQFELVAVSVSTQAIQGLVRVAAAVAILLSIDQRGTALLAAVIVGLAFAAGLWVFRSARTAADVRAALTSRLVQRVGGFRSYSIYGAASTDAVQDKALMRRYRRAIVGSDVGCAFLGPILTQLILLLGILLLVDPGASASTRGAVLGGVVLLAIGVQQAAAAAADLLANLPAARSAIPLLRRPKLMPVQESPLGSQIATGEHIFLAGGTASGKTTAMALLAAATPRSSLVSHSRPEDTLHQSLGFNLFAGAGWPPDDAALKRVRGLVERYQLADLVDAMPQGLAQPVGETGWRLSQGEHARLGLVRALAADPDMLLVDGTLETLDPETRLVILNALGDEKRTVLVSAWPSSKTDRSASAAKRAVDALRAVKALFESITRRP